MEIDDSRRPVPGIDLLQPWSLGVECMHWGELVQWGQISTSKMQVHTREHMCPGPGVCFSFLLCLKAGG